MKSIRKFKRNVIKNYETIYAKDLKLTDRFKINCSSKCNLISKIMTVSMHTEDMILVILNDSSEVVFNLNDLIKVERNTIVNNYKS